MSVEHFKTVSLRDQAIDWNAMAVDQINRFMETRDLALVTRFIKPAQRPTFYVLREIPNELADNYVLGREGEPDLNDPGVYRRAFKAGLVRVENLRVRDGVILPDFEPAKDTSGILRDAELGRFGQAERLEVGTVAIQRGFFPPGTEPTFQLPRFLLQLLAHPTRPSAARNPASQAPSSEPASSGSAAPITSTTTEITQSASGSNTASPTPATAPAQSSAGG